MEEIQKKNKVLKIGIPNFPQKFQYVFSWKFEIVPSLTFNLIHAG